MIPQRHATAAAVVVVAWALGLAIGASSSRFIAVLPASSSHANPRLDAVRPRDANLGPPTLSLRAWPSDRKRRRYYDVLPNDSPLKAAHSAAEDAPAEDAEKVITYLTRAWTFRPTVSPPTKAPTLAPTQAPSLATYGCWVYYESGRACSRACPKDGTVTDYTTYCQKMNTPDDDYPWHCHCNRQFKGFCFSESAEVSTPHGRKIMRDLRAGDEVLAVSRDGRLFYDRVMTFGHHEDTPGAVPFTQLSVAGPDGKTLQLAASANHFVPTFRAPDQYFTSAVMKYAKDVRRGDFLAVMRGNATDLAYAVVTDVTTVLERGLYLPITLSGTVLVDGVVASVGASQIYHSSLILSLDADELGAASRCTRSGSLTR
jgi:hypothetical protein